MTSSNLTPIITASIAAIGFLYKYPFLYLKKSYNLRKEKEKLRLESEKKASEAFDKLNVIFKQFYNNGGSTLMDKVDKLVIGQQDLEKRFDHFETRFDTFEERQKFMLNSQNVAFWYSDNNGAAIYVSPALCKMVRRTESEMLGSAWVSNVIQIDRDRISKAWQSSVLEKRVFDEIYTFQSDNEFIKVHGLAFHLKNKKTGEHMGSYGTLTLN